MNIQDLEYYHELVRVKNFSKVATNFNVSQPTITNAVKRLESELHTSLFFRDQSHHAVTVTSSGQQFDQHVAIILSELEIAHKEMKNNQQQKIRFGLPPIIGNYFFPPLTPLLMRHQLMTRLEVIEHGSTALLEMIRHGDLDIALLGSIIPLNYPRLTSTTISRAPIRIIVGREHPLAAKAHSGVYFTELAKEKFITFDEGFVHNQAFRSMTKINHLRPHIIYKTADVHVIKSLVAENIGISYLTGLAILPSNNLVQVPLLDRKQPEFLVSAVRRNTAIMTDPKQDLWELLTNYLPK
ncbi:LysR family transcriptional regulator [uncultured Limosilactobacillus sp.]|uniref:LysR family transcriptional regulator n=1 Tax=uncultured Limosilactobacillus sp. TaxID=2837629 RepID=UPI0025E72F1B|nr:LysR family transcriptional regulator [uncultured Limosilactobacillus sp.]